MIQRKVIAQNITNLTDARYFAAWGVAYVSFNLIMDSPYYLPLEKIEEIKEWVEGPSILIESNSVEYLDGIDGHILSNIYSSLPLNKEAFFRASLQDLSLGLSKGKYIVKINHDEIDQIQNLELNTDTEVLLDISDFDFSHLDKLPDWGLVVQGGEEEKVGVKSYDELDVLYDFLMDED